MPRPTKEQIDDEILEAAATLFARHGFKETSVQRIADAVGYSKTGLLHRFPTKEALQQAVTGRALREVRLIADEADGMPPGPARDRQVIAAMARMALNYPGIIALLLSGLTVAPEDDFALALDTLGEQIFALFATDPETDPVRCTRVLGALGALALIAVAMRDKPLAVSIDDLIEVSCAALGTTH